MNDHALTRHHARQLVFLEVGIDPQPPGGHHRQQLRTGLGVGANPRATVADHAIHRGAQFGVADVQLCQVTLGLRLNQCGAGLLFLSGNDVQLPLRRQQLSLGAIALRLGGLERGVGPLRAFHRDGIGADQFFVARVVIA
ncbi:hypothetical protein D3C84_775160 [compost metagenome]